MATFSRSYQLLLLGALALLTLAACPNASRDTRKLVSPHDPVMSLPDARRFAEVSSRYQFEAGPDFLRMWNIRLGQSGNPSAQLLLARAYLDGLLLAELTRDDTAFAETVAVLAELDAEAAEEPWAAIDRLFARIESDDPAIVKAGREAQQLIVLLRTRDMTARYHEKLDALADGFFGAEARLARILDVHSAREEIEQGPLDLRLDAFVRALGPSVCRPLPDVLTWQTCELACRQAHWSHDDPVSEESVVLASCGRRLAFSVRDDVYSPRLALVARVHERVLDDAVWLGDHRGHPLAHAAAPLVDALVESWRREPMWVGLDLDRPDDFRDLKVPITQSAQRWSDERLMLVLDDELARLALPLGIEVGDDTPLDLHGSQSNWGFPGTPLFRLTQARTRDDDLREHVIRHVRSRYERGIVKLDHSGTHSTLALLVHNDLPLVTAATALQLIRQSIGRGGQLDLEVVVWSHSALAVVPVKWAGPVAGPPIDDVPEAARPLDLTLSLQNQQVTVVARDKVVGMISRTNGRVDLDQLALILSKARALSPAERTTTVALDCESDCNWTWGGLVALLDQLHETGLDIVVSNPDLTETNANAR